jgi:autotransporter-associated beta strand protein
MPRQLGTLTLREGAEIRNSFNNGQAPFEFERLNVEAGVLSAELVGSGPMTKTGDGTVVLNWDNFRYSGNVEVLGGILDVRRDHALGTSSVVLTGGSLSNRGSSRVTIANDIVLAGGELLVGGEPQLPVGELVVTGTIHVGDEARVGMRETGRLAVTGTIQSSVADANLRFAGEGIGGLVLQPSIHVDANQTLAILVEEAPIALAVSGNNKFISGGGAIGNDAVIMDQAEVRPGASTGVLTFQSDFSFGDGSLYEWEINHAFGAAGSAMGWDVIRVGEVLRIEATRENPAKIAVLGLDGTGEQGQVADFDANRSYEWLIATADSIEGFDTSAFEIDAAAFVASNPIPDDGLFLLRRFGTDLLLGYLPAPRLVADFDQDGLITTSDIDLLCGEVAGGGSQGIFDLTGDGQVNADDVAEFLRLVPALPGDADLSGEVQFPDFVVLANHFAQPGTYSQGDFDCDGLVQFPDFVILANHFGQTTAGETASVPEPRGTVLAWIGLLLLRLGYGRVGLMLPVEALQIDFSKHYHQIRNVDFSINEQAFLDWCRAAKWTPTPIEEEARVSPVQTPDTEIVVTDGYQAVTVPIDGDFGGTVIYDRKRGRTFYRFHSF